MPKLLTCMFLILLLASCEEQTAWDLHTGNTDFIVVDGIITSEHKFQSIKVSKPVAQLNEKPDPVSGATVLVSSNQVTYTFHESPSLPGTYLSDKAFTGIRNRTYSLLITSDKKVYSAKAALASPENFVFVKYEKNTNDNRYRFSKLPVTYNPLKLAMYELQLDWSSVPGYQNENPDSCRAKLFYYTLPTIDVSEVFAPGIENVTFPSGTVITERRYSLTDEHAAFIRAVLLETTWQGGYFNTAPANVPTNLSQGATGFFGACGVTEKTEIIK